MLRYLLPVVLVIGIVLAVSIGTGHGHPRADFRFISRGSINSLDPAQMTYMQDIQMAQALWEGLTALHPKTFQPIEGVAYLPADVSADARRYVFTLRPEARWSNGDPVTAHDFVRGWRRAIEPGTADAYAELVSTHLAGAKAYADWRNAYVEVLGVVRLLQKGSPVKAELVAKALRQEPGKFLVDLLHRPIPDPPPQDQDDFWSAAAEALRQARIDWKALGDRILDTHIAQMDERFARVGLRAMDDHHLEVRLERPTPYFFDLTAFSTYMPIHRSIEFLRETYDGRPLTDTAVWSYDSQWTKPRYVRGEYRGLITNGPYLLKEWVFKQHLVIEENPFYWARSVVRSKRVEVVDSDYQNAAFLLYEQGRADMMMDLAMDYTPELVRLMREGKRHDIHPVPAFGTYYLTCNCRPRLNDGRPNPVADVRVRRALGHAINKQEIVDHVVRLDNPVSTAFVPAGQVRGYTSPQGLLYDPDLAHRELAEAGYPGGQGLPVIEYLYNTGFNQEPIAQALKRMWERQLGIQVQLVGKETKTFAEDKTAHRFTLARAGWFGDYMDPTTFLDLFQSENGHNSAGFSDAHYDGLLRQAAQEPDPARRLQILSEAEAYLVADPVPVLPLYTYVMVYAWRPNVTGIYPNPRAQFPTQYFEKLGVGSR